MDIEINCSDANIKDENLENESELDDMPKSNGFLYVDINDYSENNLDGIEIKEEEEQVEVITSEKSSFETNEICSEESFPLLRNLANHSEDLTKIENCTKDSNVNSKKEIYIKSVLSQYNSVDSESLSCQVENSESNHYKLRARNWCKVTNVESVENIVQKKNKKVFCQSKTFCSECGVDFIFKNNFLNHEAEKSHFECSKCKKCFCSGSLLESHLKSCKARNKKNFKFSDNNNQVLSQKYSKDNEKTFFKCDKCMKSFKKKQNLVSHVFKSGCSSENYICAICDEKLTGKSSLRKHIGAHLENENHFGELKNSKTLNNPNCTEVVNNRKSCQKNNLGDKPKIQLSRKNGAKSNKILESTEVTDNQSSEVSCSPHYKCQLCKKIYKGMSMYKKHLKSHAKNEINNKNIKDCGLSSECKDFTEDNAKTNTKSKKKFKYECDTCGKGFIKLIRLKIHILNIHQGVNYQCQKCSVKFTNQEDLDNHKNKQDCKTEDVCTCKTCGKVFAKKDYLKKHQYMHMNVLFKCKYCYCAFMKEKSYKRHMEKMNCSKSARKIRMAEFNFKKCRLCEVEFDTEELLINHFRESHIGLEPHQCFCCDSCLPTFQDLQNHIHQHNIQKYTCHLCGKPYTSQEGFRKHRLKHKGAEFKCQFCESEFLNESRFKFHEKTCKKNPKSGYEPSQEKEKPKKKDEKPKQSRQLHWESRIIMKRLRGDPKLLSGNQSNPGGDQPGHLMTSTFFDEPEIDTADDRGWFNNYYKTDEDDIAFGLKKAEEPPGQDCDSDFDVSEFLQTGSAVQKKKARSPVPNAVNSNSAEECEMDEGLDKSSESSSEDSSTDSEEEVKNTDLPIDYNPKKCRLCVITFGQEYELLHHFIKTHPGEYAHKCPQCEVQCPLYAQLKEHMKTHGIGIGIFNCDNCSKQFKSEKKMNSHNIRCKGINNKMNSSDQKFPIEVSCKRCGKKFHSKFGYRRHKKLCKKQKGKNKSSEKIISDSGKLKEKAVVVDDADDGNDCHLSDVKEEYEEEDLLADSNKPVSRLVSNEKSIKSVEEPAKKKKEVEEKKNEEVKNNYTGEPPMDSFPCRLCDKKFQYERGIVMHFKSAHPGQKPLICHVCNMHLADKLKEHLKTHGIGEEFICELCGKRFNQKFLSKIHEMWHQGIEYKCNNCKQKFLNKEKMEKHIGENRCSNRQSLMRLPCDICGKSYRSKFGLSKHYITHTPKELRPVKNRMNCEYCGKWFEYNNGLQRHRRIHTGERPFCCRFCPKAFAQEGNCKAHERIHTGESKPRKKKISAAPMSSASSNIPPTVVMTSENPSFPPPPTAVPVATVEPVTYPEHINLYIYNSSDPNAIVH